MDYTNNSAPVNTPVEFRACVAVTGIKHGPTRDEWADIRRAARLPGGIDRTICGACGERAWTMVEPAGLCVDCCAAWLDGRAA